MSTLLKANLTHALIVLQDRTLQDEIPRFPSPKILAPLRQVPFLVPDLRDWFLGFPYDIGREERDNLIFVLDRQINQSL